VAEGVDADLATGDAGLASGDWTNRRSQAAPAWSSRHRSTVYNGLEMIRRLLLAY